MIYEYLLSVNPVALIVGYMGGAVTMLNSVPNEITASLIGSGFVAIILAICTMVGERIGNYLIKKSEALWKKYKAKKK